MNSIRELRDNDFMKDVEENDNEEENDDVVKNAAENEEWPRIVLSDTNDGEQPTESSNLLGGNSTVAK